MRDLLSISNYVKEVGEEAITNEFQSLRSSGKKLDIHKYNEVLAAKVFKGDVGEITEVVNTIIQDGVTPNNTTVRSLCLCSDIAVLKCILPFLLMFRLVS